MRIADDVTSTAITSVGRPVVSDETQKQRGTGKQLLVLRIRSREKLDDFWKEEHQATVRGLPVIGGALFRCLEGGTETGVPGEPLVPYYAFYDLPLDRAPEIARALQLDWLRAFGSRVQVAPDVYEPTYEAPAASTIGEGYDSLFMAETGFDFTTAKWDAAVVEKWFDKWYLDVHVRLENVVGLRRVRRFRPLYRPWFTLVLYEMTSPDVLYSEENIRIRGLGPYEQYRSQMERCIGEKVGGYVNLARDVIPL